MNSEISQSSEEGNVNWLRLCLELAQRAPALPSNFRVGAALVHAPTQRVLSTGYTNELPGNTHAEQVCLQKLAAQYGAMENAVGMQVPLLREGGVVLYTTVEPCVERLSGNLPCVERVLATRSETSRGIEVVYVGVTEPDTFVKKNEGRAKLQAAGIAVHHVPGLEKEILEVAMAGHTKTESLAT